MGAEVLSAQQRLVLLLAVLAGCLGERPMPRGDGGTVRGGRGGQAGQGDEPGMGGEGGDVGQGGESGSGAGGSTAFDGGAAGNGPPLDASAPRDVASPGTGGRGGAGPGGAGGAPCVPQCTGVCSGPDGCGGTCSVACAAPETCGGGGNPRTCGCTRQCSGRCGGNDGCGSTCFDNCVAPEVCGGAGTPNVCGEVPGCSTAAGSPRWRQLPKSDPWPGSGQRMAFVHDTGRDRFVLFVYGETWEWNPGSGSWVNRNPSSAPGGRIYPAMAYDPVRRRVLLFGGYNSGELNDTWEWDGAGGTWTQRKPGRTPPGTDRHGMAHDPIRGRTVMVPGAGVDNPSTWEWDGSNWSDRPNSENPAPNGSKVLVWDGPQQRMTLVAQEGEPRLWYLRASDGGWISIPIGCGPEARHQASVTFVPDRGEILYYGGLVPRGGSDYTYHRDLWRWAPDGLGWRKYNVSGTWPATTFDGSLVHDGVRGRVLMFSGALEVDLSDSFWELKF